MIENDQQLEATFQALGCLYRALASLRTNGSSMPLKTSFNGAAPGGSGKQKQKAESRNLIMASMGPLRGGAENRAIDRPMTWVLELQWGRSGGERVSRHSKAAT